MGSNLNVAINSLAEVYSSMLTEAVNMPPAIVHQQSAFTSAFIQFIKGVENPSQSGKKNGQWFPYRVSDREVDIGYGHKIQAGENFAQGINDAAVEKLLMTDLVEAQAKARRFVNEHHGKNAFENLDQTRKEMLTDFAFNLGSLNAFPKFVKAVVYNDVAGMNKEYKRSAFMNGQRTLIGRNQQFYDTFLKNYNGGYFIAPH